MKTFENGESVKVNCSGHRKDGEVGVVTYYGRFMNVWFVEFDGDRYAFNASELIKEES